MGLITEFAQWKGLTDVSDYYHCFFPSDTAFALRMGPKPIWRLGEQTSNSQMDGISGRFLRFKRGRDATG